MSMSDDVKQCVLCDEDVPVVMPGRRLGGGLDTGGGDSEGLSAYATHPAQYWSMVKACSMKSLT